MKEKMHSHNKVNSKQQPPKSATTKNLDALAEKQSPLAAIIQRATLNPGSLNPPDVVQLQRLIGNQATERLLSSVAPIPDITTKTKRNSLQRQANTQAIQREVKLGGKFNEEGSNHQQALFKLWKEDAKDLTPEEVNRWGLDPLLVPLFGKLFTLQNTDIIFITGGAKGAFGVTTLYVVKGGKPYDTDEQEGKGIIAKREVEKFKLVIKLKPYPDTVGQVMQILNHELSLHGEDYANLVNEYWQNENNDNPIGDIENAEKQHEHLVYGENVRYIQIRNRLKETLSEKEWENYKLREQQDVSTEMGPAMGRRKVYNVWTGKKEDEVK